MAMQTYNYKYPLLTDDLAESAYISLNVELTHQHVRKKESTLNIYLTLYNYSKSYNILGTEAKSTLKVNDSAYQDTTVYVDLDELAIQHVYARQGAVVKHNSDGTCKLTIDYTLDWKINSYYYNADYAQAGALVDRHFTFEVDLPTLDSYHAIFIDTPDMVDNNVYSFTFNQDTDYNFLIESYIELFDDENSLITTLRPETFDISDATKGTWACTYHIPDATLQPIRAALYDQNEATAKIWLMSTYGGVERTYVREVPYKITHAYPVIDNIMIRDVQSTITELTGDPAIIVKGESMAEYVFEPIALKEARIVEQSVTNGSQTISDMTVGIIDAPESGLFRFKVKDSRGLSTVRNETVPFVDYVRPTVHVKLETEFETETTVILKVTVTGDYYNGSFGAVDNTIEIYRNGVEPDSDVVDQYTDALYDDFEITFEGNKYTATYSYGSQPYGEPLYQRVMVRDKLYSVASQTQMITTEPLFDWADTDFNFNVPVNMHGETVLRHNRTDDHTILSASGGRMHFRPHGTEDETDQFIIYPGIAPVGGSDYVIETGTESMGTNGTWYWRKYASGRAECFGIRNMGKLAVTTAWGSLYRSATIFQALPTDLFWVKPMVIAQPQPNYNNNGQYGGWIAEFGDGDNYVWVSPVSTTLASSYIGFYCQGYWTLEGLE